MKGQELGHLTRLSNMIDKSYLTKLAFIGDELCVKFHLLQPQLIETTDETADETALELPDDEGAKHENKSEGKSSGSISVANARFRTGVPVDTGGHTGPGGGQPVKNREEKWALKHLTKYCIVMVIREVPDEI